MMLESPQIGYTYRERSRCFSLPAFLLTSHLSFGKRHGGSRTDGLRLCRLRIEGDGRVYTRPSEKMCQSRSAQISSEDGFSGSVIMLSSKVSSLQALIFWSSFRVSIHEVDFTNLQVLVVHYLSRVHHRFRMIEKETSSKIC